MKIRILRVRLCALMAGATLLVFSGWASADPPSRIGRLGYFTGPVSFSPAGESDWNLASLNRPLTVGDRLWTDSGARAEIQVGGALIRIKGDTGVSILNLDERIIQLQLTQGTLNVRVRRLERNQVFEVATPNLALTLRQPGEYRIEVAPDGRETTVIVRKGKAEAYGENTSYLVDARQSYRFMGTGLREYDYVNAPRADEFDRWSSTRDRSYENSRSALYVSPDVVGYQDLDANGSWRTDSSYGNVWVPNRVAADWAPYRDGHWTWVDPWGWTWVDDAVWGFAVSHYGRWANLRGTWAWVPGPVRSRAYYAPALVAFVGGNNFQLNVSGGSVGGVAWFPLAPREAYRPSYAASRAYFENVNRSNTVVNSSVINNTYNNSNVTNIVYANRQVPGAVVAVPATVFVQSQPVSRAAVRVAPEILGRAPIAVVPALAPTEKSVRGNTVRGERPPGGGFERPVVARSAPPPARIGFAAQQQQLAATPGQPLSESARKALKPEAGKSSVIVKLAAPSQSVPPTAAPPLVAPAGKPAAVEQPARNEQRGRPEQSRREQRERPAAMPAAPAPVAAPVPTPATPQLQPGATEQPARNEQRARPEQSRREQRERPAAMPPAPAPAAAPVPTPATPQLQPGAAEQPARNEQRGRPEQSRREQRERPAAMPPPPAPAPAPAAPAPAPAPAAAPAPATPQLQPRAAEQGARNEQRGRPERPGPEQRARPVPQPPAPAQAVPPPQAVPPAAQAVQPPKADAKAEANKPEAGKSKQKKEDRDDKDQESGKPGRR